MMKLIRSSRIPIIIVALNMWDTKLRYIRLLSHQIEFKAIPTHLIKRYILKILKDKKIKFDEEAVELIAENASGDVRAALTDLQVTYSTGKSITKEALILSQRAKSITIFDTLKKVFKSTDTNEVLYSLENLDMENTMVFLWIAENVAREYEDPREIADAYNYLSRSDIFMGRISRRQHMGLMYYANVLATVGVSSVKKNPYRKFVRYNMPNKIKQLIKTKADRNITKNIAAKIAAVSHTSSKKAEHDYIPMLRNILKKKELRECMVQTLQLEPEELKFLT